MFGAGISTSASNDAKLSNWTTIVKSPRKAPLKKDPLYSTPAVEQNVQRKALVDVTNQKSNHTLSDSKIAPLSPKKSSIPLQASYVSPMKTTSTPSVENSKERLNMTGDAILSTSELTNRSQTRSPIGSERADMESYIKKSLDTVDFTPFYGKRLQIPSHALRDFLYEI